MNLNLMDVLQGQLPDDLVDQLSSQIGGADRQQTAMAASGIMTTLVSALARNASNEQGAAAIAGALDRDHDGSILNNLAGLLGGQTQAQEGNRALNGAGILQHILGDRQNPAADMISQMSGLNSNQTGNMMQILAPLVMGMLGKTKREQGLDIGGLASLLSGTANSRQAQSNPASSLVTRLLDKDGDGSAVDDIARIGMNVLGNLFKKK
ncbi:MAG: DUF937 domain-containing protein [Saprospiraceae bacterium]|nr:DUF937 domain-containing protein [Saprospiraceae bacterium]